MTLLRVKLASSLSIGFVKTLYSSDSVAWRMAASSNARWCRKMACSPARSVRICSFTNKSRALGGDGVGAADESDEPLLLLLLLLEVEVASVVGTAASDEVEAAAEAASSSAGACV